MIQDNIRSIGFKQTKRKDARLADINKVQGLKKILDQDFKSWSNFNNWKTNKPAAQFIVARAIDVNKGRKIDIRCGCCDYIGEFPKDLDIRGGNLSCYAIKTQWIIEKVIEEVKVTPSYKGMKPEDFN